MPGDLGGRSFCAQAFTEIDRQLEGGLARLWEGFGGHDGANADVEFRKSSNVAEAGEVAEVFTIDVACSVG